MVCIESYDAIIKFVTINVWKQFTTDKDGIFSLLYQTILIRYVDFLYFARLQEILIKEILLLKFRNSTCWIVCDIDM